MSDASIPIEISVAKLQDWLTSRRHCSKDWQKAILPVREKISHAIQDMPELDEVRDLLSGTFINYYHCQRIIEILKETEKDSKSFFGSYSSQRMKDWLEIVKLYESENLFLADASQQLYRTLTYEIPSLKRQIAKLAQQRSDSVSKEESYVKNSEDMLNQFKRECDKLGIQGKFIRKELLSLLDDMPVVFDEVVSKLGLVRPMISYYREFVEFTQGELAAGEDFFPMVNYILANGNTTTYQWRTGKIPDIVEELKPNIPEIAEIVAEDQIDFGDDDEAMSAGTSQSNGDFVHLDADLDNEDNISWDISVQDDESGNDNIGSSDSNEGGASVAKGLNAISVLHNPETREMFLNELRELEFFLRERVVELKIEGDVILVHILQSAPDSIQKHTSEKVVEMLRQLKELLGLLETHKMTHLFTMHSSPNYIDRIIAGLEHKLSLSEKYQHSKKAVVAQRHESLLEQEKLEPQLALIVEKTRLLKSQIEETISQKYKGRPVHLTGISL